MRAFDIVGCSGSPSTASLTQRSRRTPVLNASTLPVKVSLNASEFRVSARQRQRSLVCNAEKSQNFGGFTIEAPADLGDPEQILEIPNLRSKLNLRPSPFAPHNNFNGGFVSDLDRVALNSMKFASPDSAGAGSRVIGSALSGSNSHTGHNGAGLLEASMEQLLIPLPPWAVRAGARREIYYDPTQVTAAIVTCGGLCPGLNDVVAGLVNKLTDYGVPEGKILGIKYGFRGFYDQQSKPVVLTKRTVDGIQLQGGTILGTSRGGANIREIVKRIDMWGIDMLFVVGGNGGNAGANAIQAMCQQHDVNCCVVGIPKSIDNDILLIDKCFGFDTAVEESQRALLAAKVEASSAHKGIGLVKLMGRQSGFIAMQASMASGVVDAVLIPEVNFKLKGDHGLLAYLESVIKYKGHAVVCVAEGAGQDLLEDGGSLGTDASGNPILRDIGMYLKSEIKAHPPLKDADVKYIDPTYMIRAIPTTSTDRIYCKILAHNAVHAAFAGYTGLTVGLVNTHYVLLPIPVVIQAPRKVDPRGKAWNRLRASIGQPNFV